MNTEEERVSTMNNPVEPTETPAAAEGVVEEDVLVEEELLVEEISIDGMCGVY